MIENENNEKCLTPFEETMIDFAEAFQKATPMRELLKGLRGEPTVLQEYKNKLLFLAKYETIFDKSDEEIEVEVAEIERQIESGEIPEDWVLSQETIKRIITEVESRRNKKSRLEC